MNILAIGGFAKGSQGLENRTTVTRLDAVLTDKLRAEFIGRGKFTPSNDA